MADFSERIKELRSSYGYSQQKLADMLNVSKSTVNMYERGERKPGMDQLEAIADYFNVDMDYLSGKSDIPRKTLICSEQPPVNRDIYSKPEKVLIEKYRKLDVYGQKTVNLLVDSELERSGRRGRVFKSRHLDQIIIRINRYNTWIDADYFFTKFNADFLFLY